MTNANDDLKSITFNINNISQLGGLSVQGFQEGAINVTSNVKHSWQWLSNAVAMHLVCTYVSSNETEKRKTHICLFYIHLYFKALIALSFSNFCISC